MRWNHRFSALNSPLFVCEFARVQSPAWLCCSNTEQLALTSEFRPHGHESGRRLCRLYIASRQKVHYTWPSAPKARVLSVVICKSLVNLLLVTSWWWLALRNLRVAFYFAIPIFSILYSVLRKNCADLHASR